MKKESIIFLLCTKSTKPQCTTANARRLTWPFHDEMYAFALKRNDGSRSKRHETDPPPVVVVVVVPRRRRKQPRQVLLHCCRFEERSYCLLLLFVFSHDPKKRCLLLLLLLSPFVRMHWLAILLFVSKAPSQTHRIFVQPDLSKPRSKCLSPATTERNGTMNVQKPPSTKNTPKQGRGSSNNNKPATN